MGVLVESWCFCNGGGKSERTKAAIFSGKGPATAMISGDDGVSGTGFLIHRNLLLTTHANLPSVAAAEAAEIRLQSGVGASLFPHSLLMVLEFQRFFYLRKCAKQRKFTRISMEARLQKCILYIGPTTDSIYRFFISSSVLDLTIVGLDTMDGDSIIQSQQPHYLKTCSKPNLELGNSVYVLGYTETNELAIGEGKVVIATDNLIKLSTDGACISPGSAGFDVQGNLAFMVCDPMKLATSPNTKSTSTSSSSKKDLPMQFGVPIPIICDWLNQHWEGNLDELNKPKLPLLRLMSTGQKSEYSCASFTKRKVFKSNEPGNEETPSSSSNVISNTGDGIDDETITPDARAQGIPTPKIYETRKLTSFPVRKKSTSPIQLLNINFPHKLVKPPALPPSVKKLTLFSDENHVTELLPSQPPSIERIPSVDMVDADMASTGSVNGAQSEVQSSSSPIEILNEHNEYSSEGETTMYSAETAESRNYPSPRERRLQQTGRSQSCVNYNRSGSFQKYPLARKAIFEKQRSFTQGGKVNSQGTNSKRSNNDFYGPTVSSIMKKRMDSQQPNRPRPSPVHSSSPRWMF